MATETYLLCFFFFLKAPKSALLSNPKHIGHFPLTLADFSEKCAQIIKTKFTSVNCSCKSILKAQFLQAPCPGKAPKGLIGFKYMPIFKSMLKSFPEQGWT